MKSDFLIAVTQLAAERNLPQDMVVSAVEAALASAYRRDGASGSQSNIRVHLDPNTGEVEVYQIRTVVEEVTNELAEITLGDAKRLTRNQGLSIGDTLEEQLSAHAAGRIAAQTAKQVVFQRLREAERELVYAEFAEKSGEVYTATVQRSFGGAITMDLNGRASATLPPTEQSPMERYRPGMKLKVIITEVTRTQRGPEIIVSRTHPDLLRRLFEMEVPEIYNGIVEIRGIAREPGSRSKVAVFARQDGVDPVGACVGLRGIRIQNIVNELQGEKIDVIQWSRDLSIYISHALSPAQPLRVDLNEAEQAATIVVPDRQLSLAIGREGQNARLAAKLTNWKIDIKSSTEIEIERMRVQIEGVVAGRESEEAEVVEAVAVVPDEAGEDTVEKRAAAIAAEEAAIMAELEAEATAAQQVQEAEQIAGGLSPEEMLALESLDQVDEEIEEIIVEEVEEDFGEDDIWKVPEPIGGGPTIRFAEDILGAPQGNRRGGGRRRGGAGPRRSNAPNRGGGRRPGGPATTGTPGGDDLGG
ncbi:MAG: transcription termination factor NusA [Chloroflexota bacterium]|nr:transcription termination factor NusA [Chloroflexota bacterium]MDE2885066.1 transcription termination factor NusA [Chloroflexota bacterium]